MFFRSPRQAAQKLSEIYDSIAEDFSQTRQKNWREAELLFTDTPLGACIADIGCGNGRLNELFVRKNCVVTGIDISEKLLSLARVKYKNSVFMKGGFDNIPCPEDSFDEVWTLASFHHLPTPADRLLALKQMHRVLKSHGQVVMTVWNLWEQKKYAAYKIRACVRSLFFPQWTHRDFLIPWRSHEIPRYYHSFSPSELMGLARGAGFSVIECWGLENGEKGSVSGCKNICLRLRKKVETFPVQ